MPWWGKLSLEEFLSKNPKMRLVAMSSERVVIEGDYDICAQMDGHNLISTTYKLRITISDGQPPIVHEIGGAIAKTSDNHINPDGAFCLGSGIRIKSILHDTACLSYFAEKILDPFLYSISHKLQFGNFPYGELAHGEEGLVDDYEQLFRVSGKLAVLRALSALGRRKREANKLPCPCGCGLRLGKCDYRFSLNQWRRLAKRSWFREHLGTFTPIPKPKPKKRRRTHSYK